MVFGLGAPLTRTCAPCREFTPRAALTSEKNQKTWPKWLNAQSERNSSARPLIA